MKSSREVPADVETTWRALNDPETLKACIPGCETIERVSDTEFKVAMAARVGPVSARFNGRIALSEIVPPKSYTLNFEGQGGAAGFVKGETKVALESHNGGTRIDYAVKAQVGGKLAQIGSRLVDGAANKTADDFFARFVERLGAQTGMPVTPAPAGPARAWDNIWLRLALAAAIIAIMFYWWLTRSA